jgi:hypothetical protein
MAQSRPVLLLDPHFDVSVKSAGTVPSCMMRLIASDVL